MPSKSQFTPTERFMASLSTKLQLSLIFLSLVGIGFGIKSWLHVVETYGESDKSALFFNDLIYQIIIAALVNIAVGWYIHRATTKRIVNLGERMRDLTEDRLDIEIPYLKEKDQIGSMARKVQIFKDNAINLKNLQAEQAQNRKHLEAERKKFLSDMAERVDASINRIAGRLNESGETLSHSSETLVEASDTVAAKMKELNQIASKTSSNVTHVAEAAHQLSRAVEEISLQVARSSSLTREAVDKAANADKNIKGLADGAAKVGAVIELVRNIAAQINLLALNATIEAARAGEAGKGFSVVASEVKNLATQTAKATEQIAQIISGIQSETDSAVVSIQEITQSVMEVNEIATMIASAVEEQDASTRGMAANIGEAASLTNQLAGNVEIVAGVSQKAGHEASGMRSACQLVREQSDALSSTVEEMVQSLRKA